MSPVIIVPFIVGIIAVLQASVNKKISSTLGLAPTVTLATGLLALQGLVLLFLTIKMKEKLPSIYHLRHQSFGEFIQNIEWWYILPGLGAFVFIACMPWVVSKVGAFSAFLALICGQVFTSILWDFFQEGKPITIHKIIGAILVLAGALLVR